MNIKDKFDDQIKYKTSVLFHKAEGNPIDVSRGQTAQCYIVY
jgi:hypothetical protein